MRKGDRQLTAAFRRRNPGCGNKKRDGQSLDEHGGEAAVMRALSAAPSTPACQMAPLSDVTHQEHSATS